MKQQPDLLPEPPPPAVICHGVELFEAVARLRAEGFVIEAVDSLGGATWRLHFRPGKPGTTAGEPVQQ